MDYVQEVRKVLVEGSYECPGDDVPLRQTLDLDSLEMAEVAILLEERWVLLEDRIEFDDDLWHSGTLRQIAARVEQIVESQAA